MQFPEKIIKLSSDRGLSARKVAAAMKVSPTTVGRWMDGTSKISLADATQLARVLKVDLNFLGNDEQDRPDPPIISEDESVLLRVFRSSGLSVDDAIALFTRRDGSGAGRGGVTRHDQAQQARETG